MESLQCNPCCEEEEKKLLGDGGRGALRGAEERGRTVILRAGVRAPDRGFQGGFLMPAESRSFFLLELV